MDILKINFHFKINKNENIKNLKLKICKIDYQF